MPRRKKSIEDIKAQAKRIEALGNELARRDCRMDWYAARYGEEAYNKAFNNSEKRSDSRIVRANYIARQYIDNISKTASYERAKQQYKNAATDEERNAISRSVETKQHSQSTYRGFSEG